MMKTLSAKQAGLVSCHSCELVSRVPQVADEGVMHCPRCGATLHQRKVNSIARTWSLIIAALVLYIPANMLPITVVTTFGRSSADTIMSGVIYFLQSGEWPIAAVIFIASIFVPVLKLLILMYLLISVQRRSHLRSRERTRLYRVTELIGKWSMVDIYVVTVLVALVQFGNLSDIVAGPAALYFGAVVILTIFAANSFDPRLIWDAEEQ